MAYQHPGLRNNALPNVRHLKAAIRSADDPNPRTRDIRPLVAICTALPQADPDILGFMQTRRLNLLSWPWRVEAPPTPGGTSAEARELQRAADIETRIRECGITSEFDAVANALYFGHTGIELAWSTAVDGAHRIERYELIDAVDLHPDAASITGYSRVTYARPDDDKMILVPYAARENLLLATYNPMKGGKALYYGGLLRSVIWHTMLKHGNLYDWARFNEKFGDPPVIARYPVGAQAPDIAVVFEFLRLLAQDSAAAIPDDVKIDIIDALKSGANIETFDRFIDRISSKQERILLGQDVVNKTTEVGSNAKSQEANKTTANYNFADIELFQTWLSEQVVAADYRLNYGVPPRGQYPRFRIVTDEGEDYERNARIIERLDGAGWDLDPDEIQRKTGFTVKRKPAAPDLDAAF